MPQQSVREPNKSTINGVSERPLHKCMFNAVQLTEGKGPSNVLSKILYYLNKQEVNKHAFNKPNSNWRLIARSSKVQVNLDSCPSQK